MRKRPQHVEVQRTRHGRTVFYFRRRGKARIRLPDEYGSPEFWRAYSIAQEHTADARRRRSYDERRCAAALIIVRRGIRSARSRAAEYGLEFDLTDAWAAVTIARQQFKCALTGIPFLTPSEIAARRNPYMPSIDRIDPSRGYTADNVRIVIFAANVMLLDWGEAIFARVASAYMFEIATKAERSRPSPRGEKSLT